METRRSRRGSGFVQSRMPRGLSDFPPTNCAGAPDEGALANGTGRVVFWIPACAGMTR